MVLVNGSVVRRVRTTCAGAFSSSTRRFPNTHRMIGRSNCGSATTCHDTNVLCTYFTRCMEFHTANTRTAALHTSTSCFSTRSTHAVCRMLYGADTVPLYGSWDNAFNERALYTRQLYCKALVYASGGGRLARDWIAGSTSLTTSNASLLHIALQHNGTKEDVRLLHDHLLDIVLARRDSSDSLTLGELEQSLLPARFTASAPETTAAQSVEKEQSCEDTASSNRHACLPLSAHDYTADDVAKIENLLLLQAQETRTFLMDAMSAGLFHAHNHANIVKEAKRRVYHIATEVFGAPKSLLDTMWNVALQEMSLKKDKQRILGVPWID